MTTYISILRGINVSGRNLIKMDALKKMYAQLGFEQITTYVQSGNVVFTAKKADVKKLGEKISKQIETDFGYQVPVIVLTKTLLQKIVEENPFAGDPQKDSSFLHVTFLAEPPSTYEPKDIEDKKLPGEELHYSDNAVYLFCPGGYGNTKLSNAFLEKKLKVAATTRNWKTTTELLNLAAV